jgi:hypothetical protein
LSESSFNGSDKITPEEVILPLKRKVSRHYEFYDNVFNVVRGLQEALGLDKEKTLQYVNALANHKDLDYMTNQIFIIRQALKTNNTEELQMAFQRVFEPMVIQGKQIK